MPLLPTAFTPAWGLSNGHAQTLAAALGLHRPRPAFRRERLELEDGDFLDLDWLEPLSRAETAPLAILSHGLEGSTSAIYIRRFAQHLQQHGWRVLAWNYRSCSGVPNRLLRSYHSGETQDLRRVIEHAVARYQPERVHLLGFSLGGNLTLKYLCEAPPHAAVKAAFCLSAPVDLASSAMRLDELPSNAFYLARFLRTLKRKALAKAQRFPGKLDAEAIAASRTFLAYDSAYTAPVHGFADAWDYWARCSAKPLLGQLRVPTLLLSARDDSFLPEACFPIEAAQASEHLHFEVSDHGGHVAFVARQRGWLLERARGFLESQQ